MISVTCARFLIIQLMHGVAIISYIKSKLSISALKLSISVLKLSISVSIIGLFVNGWTTMQARKTKK